MRVAPRVLPALWAVLLAGCGAATPAGTPSAASTTTATTTPPTTAITTTTTTTSRAPLTRNWFELEPGDCLTALPQIELGDVAVPVVDCSAPHVAEVFLRVPVEVDAAVTGVADQKCRAGLPEYTADHTGYSVTYLIDSNMDRTGHTPLPSTVICLLQSPGGQPLTGSAGHG
ncbi:MAG: hypothetical protein U0R18_19940 [Mycobacterium sp.]